MKYAYSGLYLIISLFVLFVLFSYTAHAQECGQISSISISNKQVLSGQSTFNCNVTVANKNQAINDITCGVANDDQPFPQNACPSDGRYFGGWNGDVAVFQCAINNSALLDPLKHPRLVGYDYNTSKGCKVQDGKTLALIDVQFTPAPAQTSTSTGSVVGDYAQAAKQIIDALFAKIDFSNISSTGGSGGPSIGQAPEINPTSTVSSGNPPKDGTVEKLVNEIVNACGHVVTADNMSCIANANLKANVKSQITISAGTFYWYQCVGFAETVADYLGYPSLNNSNPSATAYFTNHPSGYQAIKKGTAALQVGDIPIWGGTGSGHIAVVVKIFDANTFQVAEANYTTQGYVGLRTTTIDYGNLIGWLRPR